MGFSLFCVLLPSSSSNRDEAARNLPFFLLEMNDIERDFYNKVFFFLLNKMI